MIYLFNSAYRPRYTKNVLNTLHLPELCSNEYRYKYRGDKPNISPSFFSAVSTFTGSECVVIFIDRFGEGGYDYHCLRRGKLLSHRTELDYLYLKVQLGGYISPRDTAQFKRNLLEQIGNLGVAQLTAGNPENPHDGFYAINSESIFGQLDDFHVGDAAWATTVDRLAATRAFRADERLAPVFLQTSVRARKGNQTILPVTWDGSPVFQLKKGAVYELVITYRFPKQRLDHNFECRLDLKLGDNLKTLSSTTVPIDSYSNSIAIPFTTKRYAEDNIGHIGLGAVAMEPTVTVVAADTAFEYALREGKGFWIQILAAMLIYTASGALIGTDVSKLQWASVAWHSVILKGGLAFMQALSLFWMFRAFGKKIL